MTTKKPSAYAVTKEALGAASDKQVLKALKYINAGHKIFNGPKTLAALQFVSSDGKSG